MSDLASRECIPCRGDIPPLEGEQLHALHEQLGAGWQLIDDHHLEKTYRIKVEDAELVPENLDSIASVCAFLNKKLQG